jgi:hypothetical protein
MQQLHATTGSGRHLRFLFSGSVVSFDLPLDVTLAEIAETLDHLPSDRYGPPVGIELIFADPAATPVAGQSCSR